MSPKIYNEISCCDGDRITELWSGKEKKHTSSKNSIYSTYVSGQHPAFRRTHDRHPERGVAGRSSTRATAGPARSEFSPIRSVLSVVMERRHRTTDLSVRSCRSAPRAPPDRRLVGEVPITSVRRGISPSRHSGGSVACSLARCVTGKPVEGNAGIAPFRRPGNRTVSDTVPRNTPLYSPVPKRTRSLTPL